MRKALKLSVCKDMYHERARNHFRSTFPDVDNCSECGKKLNGKGDVHHRNGNHRDNRIANLALICKTCHNRHHPPYSKSISPSELRIGLRWSEAKKIYDEPAKLHRWSLLRKHVDAVYVGKGLGRLGRFWSISETARVLGTSRQYAHKLLKQKDPRFYEALREARRRKLLDNEHIFTTCCKQV
jgi:hypothetical protein